MAHVSPIRFTLSPGNSDFADKKNNLISSVKVRKEEKIVLSSAKSQKNERASETEESENKKSRKKEGLTLLKNLSEKAVLKAENENGKGESEKPAVKKIEKQKEVNKEPLTLQKQSENKAVTAIKAESKASASAEEKRAFTPAQKPSLNEAVERAKEILSLTENRIANLYAEYFANRGFAYTLKEVIVNLEEYLQALFLVVAMNGRDIQEEEMKFIWTVLSRADIFRGTNSIEESIAKAKKVIKTNPSALLITVAVDKFYGKNESFEVVKNINEIYLLMCSLTGLKTVKKEELLAEIFAFAQAQGVKI